jgi:hypothetical protein
MLDVIGVSQEESLAVSGRPGHFSNFGVPVN